MQQVFLSLNQNMVTRYQMDIQMKVEHVHLLHQVGGQPVLLIIKTHLSIVNIFTSHFFQLKNCFMSVKQESNSGKPQHWRRTSCQSQIAVKTNKRKILKP